MTSLERLAIKSNNAYTEEVLTILLEDATQDFLNLTGCKTVPEAAKGLVEDMALYKAARAENAGISSQSYSGFSESYNTDYDTNLTNQINRFRKLKLL